MRSAQVLGKVGYEVNQLKKKYMAKKLYIGGLPYSTTEDSLKQAFAGAGTVESATIITDKMSGRSRGFGFVEMSTDEEAQKAIEMWHEKEFEGRTLTVNEARPLADRPPRRGGAGGGDRRDRNSW
jgi:RNA recognition motif-containing protein